MICKISPSSAIGKIKAPPSKSMAHRLLICAGLAKGKSIIKGLSMSKDIQATISCLVSLGAKVEFQGNDTIVHGIEKDLVPEFPTLDCCESGSTIRFFIPIALLYGNTTKFVGSETLLKRPMDIYKDLSEKHDFSFKQTENEILISGSLKSGIFSVPGNISSQFITGLMFALPLLDGDSIIKVSTPIESYSYLKLTLSALKLFGIEIKEENSSFYIKGNQKYIPTKCTVEGDYSNAAFLDAFNHIGGFVGIEGLNPNSLQGDRIYKEFFPLIDSGTPTLDISNCPDLGPVLFALASIKNGAVFNGTKRLRIKESDRIDAMASELKKVGITITAEDNQVIIPNSKLTPPKSQIFGHNDHRIVMAMSLILSITGGEITGAEAVTKSFPDYFECIKSLGIGVEIIDTE